MKKFHFLFLFTLFHLSLGCDLFGSDLRDQNDENRERIPINLPPYSGCAKISLVGDISHQPKQEPKPQRSGSLRGDDLLRAIQVPLEKKSSSKRQRMLERQEPSKKILRTRSFHFGRLGDNMEYGATPQKFMGSLGTKACQENFSGKKAESIKKFREKEQKWLETALHKKEVGQELTLGEESAYNKYQEILAYNQDSL